MLKFIKLCENNISPGVYDSHRLKKQTVCCPKEKRYCTERNYSNCPFWGKLAKKISNKQTQKYYVFQSGNELSKVLTHLYPSAKHKALFS